MFSGDGDTVLLEWEGPCCHPEPSSNVEPNAHQPSVFLADGNGGNLRSLEGRDRIEALGWSPNNEAIVAATYDGYCGDPDRTGVDAITPSGATRLIFLPPAGITQRPASVWRPGIA